MRPTLRLRGERAPDDAQVRGRAVELGIAPLLVRLLVARGIVDLPLQQSWLAPKLRDLRHPDGMAGFEAALELLACARAGRWRVGVFGDYDVDGVSTATILTTFLEALGVEVVARVAHRDRGYGLGVPDAQAFADAGCNLVVTGDVGTSDLEALSWLRARAIKTVVIDHHQVPQCPPPTDAFINPHQVDCRFPFKGLCSAGVAFYLCAALRTRLARTEAGRLPDPRGWLDLVAVATICDMMPLREENRVLVHSGLRHLGQRSRPGLRALLRVAGVDPKVRIDEEHVGYKLGPRLNAPGRLGTAAPALRLLRARTEAEAEPLAEQIEVLNARRRRHTEQTVAEALAILAVDPSLSRRAGIVVAHEGWLPGIVGIAAAGICEHHRRPTLVLAVDPAIGMARGSVRSHGGIDVRAALSACAGLLLRFGGHREAAGVSLEAHRVPELAEAFDAAVAQQQGEDAQGAGSGEEEVVDAILPFEVIDTELCDAVRILAPYGMGFETPRFASEDLVVERVRILKERHLALTVSQGGVRREAIGFGLAFHALQVGETIGCIHVPFLDHYRGDTRLRLQVERLWRSNSC